MTAHRFRLDIAALGAAIGLTAAGARAEIPSCARLTRANIVSCALRADLSARAERHLLEAARAREEAARPVLPSNPVLSGWVGRHTAPTAQPEVNWAASLSQEVEIAGQRSARRDAAELGRRSQAETVRAVDRAAAAEALRAYFETISAREQAALMRDLAATARRVAEAARGAADRGVIAGVDADVADASLVAVEDALRTRERNAREAEASLHAAVGLPQSAALTVEGPLVPLGAAEQLTANGAWRSAPPRPEVLALEAEARADRARADLFRRLRVPNPSLSAFFERTGFSENVLGFGISLPIPLPHPLGQTYAGEIAESEALARGASTRAARAARIADTEAARAVASYEAARARTALYGSDRRDRARRSLSAMAAEIAAGRLAVRDAVVAQEALVDLLLAALVAEGDLCVASVDLAFAAGAPLEQGVR